MIDAALEQDETEVFVRELREQIAERDSSLVNMSNWLDDVTRFSLEPTACGTVACIGGCALIKAAQAGNPLALDIIRLERVKPGSMKAEIEAFAVRIMGLTYPEGETVFYTVHWPLSLRERYNKSRFSDQRHALVLERLDLLIEEKWGTRAA